MSRDVGYIAQLDRAALKDSRLIKGVGRHPFRCASSTSTLAPRQHCTFQPATIDWPVLGLPT